VFDFDPLYRIDAIVNAKNHELFPLLQIFVSGSLNDLKSWTDSNSNVLSKYSALICFSLAGTSADVR
jgi:translation initiation factor 3 subunit M